MRSKDLVRAVTDGRLDLGVVRRDAVPTHVASVTFGAFGYSLFGTKKLSPAANKRDVRELLRTLRFFQVLAGGRFEVAFADWLEREEIQTNTVARVSSFVACAEAVSQGVAGAVLPDFAAGVLQGAAVFRKPLPLDYRRELAVVGNLRALDRAGFDEATLRLCWTALCRENSE